MGKKFQNTRCGENGDIRAHLEKLAVLREKLSSLDQRCQVRLGHTPGFESSVDSLANSYEANDKDLTGRLSCLRKGKNKTLQGRVLGKGRREGRVGAEGHQEI